MNRNKTVTEMFLEAQHKSDAFLRAGVLKNSRIQRLEAFVKLCRDGFFVEYETLMNAADRILKE